MSQMTAAERELAELLVEALNLEHVEAGKVDPTAPLFGSQENGWGLDSIDALEIALAVDQRYGVQLRAEDDSVRRAFGSLRSLAELIAERRSK